MSTATAQPRARELYRSLSPGLYKQAREANLTFSQWLEREDPSDRYKDGTDAYQRMLLEANIATETHPRGYYIASPASAFLASEQTRALFPEFVYRTVDRVRFRMHEAQDRLQASLLRAVYLSSDTGEGSTLRPFDDDPTPRRRDETRPAIPLEEIVRTTRFVSGDTARSTYLERDAAATRRRRVVEGMEIPGARLVTSQHSIRFGKYGIKLTITYETMRRVSLDMFSIFLEEETIQAEVDKVAHAVDVLVNGDGNANTAATTHTLTSLDPNADVGTLSLDGWIGFKLLFKNPYALTTVIGRTDPIKQLLLLNMGSANLPMASRPDLGAMTPINQQLASGVRWGVLDEAPASKLVGFDRSRAINRVVEQGSQIQEADRFITNQTNVLTVTENEGFESFLARSVRVLDLSA